MKTKNKKLYILGGFIIILILVFFKFLRKRVQGHIDFTYTPFKFYVYILLIFWFFMLMCLIVVLPMWLTHKPKNVNLTLKSKGLTWLSMFSKKCQNQFLTVLERNNNFRKTLIKIGLYYNKMIKAFSQEICEKTDSSRIWLLLFELLRLAYKKPNTLMLFLTIFYFFPPVLVALIFCFETIYVNEYNFFPYSPLLLIFPVSIQVVLYLMALYNKNQALNFDQNYVILTEVHDKENYTWSPTSKIPLENRTQLSFLFFSTGRRAISYDRHIVNEIRRLLLLASMRQYFNFITYFLSFSSFTYLVIKML